MTYFLMFLFGSFVGFVFGFNYVKLQWNPQMQLKEMYKVIENERCKKCCDE